MPVLKLTTMVLLRLTVAPFARWKPLPSPPQPLTTVLCRSNGCAFAR